MELAESDRRDGKLGNGHLLRQASRFTKCQAMENGPEAMLHFAQESLSDCSDITTPFEHSDSVQVDSSYQPRIILKDLINQTLN